MAAWLDGVKFNPTLGGTTDFVVSTAAAGCNTPAQANAVDGRVYKWRAESADLSQWEDFEGAYTVSSTTAARTTVLYNSSQTGTKTPGQSGAGTKINFTTVPMVSCIGIKEDLISIEEANSFTTAQTAQARGNISAAGLAVANAFTDATQSTSIASGALQTAGGLGVAKNIVFGNALKPTQQSVTAAQIDATSVAGFSVANTASAAVTPALSGADTNILFISETIAFGGTAIFICSGGLTPTLIGTSSIFFVVGTNTASKASVGWDGTQYRVYNNVGAAALFHCLLMRVG